MQSIGERLEEARKRKGISIREAVEATKIRGDYLQKFESNQYDIRLPEVYVRGFLRSYSNFLKLPADKIIADYNALHQGGGEPKSTRAVGRELYGSMDISTTKGKEPDTTHTGGTTPPITATTPAGGPAASLNPSTFTPPRHATGTPLDKKLIIKIGAIVVAVVVIIILAVMLATGGRDKKPSAPRETWVTAQPGEATITITVKTIPAEVKVASQAAQPGDASIIYYEGTIPAGQSRTLPRREALRVESAQFSSVQFVIDGRPWDMTATKVDIRAP
jgi:transcriptional regulator with XRE-family HTH domain